MSPRNKLSVRYGQPLAGALLVVAMATVLGLSGEALFGEAKLVRKYTIDRPDKRAKDMKEAQVQCLLKGAKLPIADSQIKDNEIWMALEDFCVENDCIKDPPYVMLGGSLTSDNCRHKEDCLWCWDYGERNCIESKDYVFAVGTSSKDKHRSYRNAYLNWVKDDRGQQPYPGQEGPYVVYSYQHKGWTGHNYDPVHYLMCVKEEEEDSTNLKTEESTDSWLSPLRIGIIAGGALLVLVVLIIVGICCCRSSPKMFFFNPAGQMGSVVSMGSMGSCCSSVGSMGSHCSSVGSMGSQCSSVGSRGSVGIIG